MGKNRAVRGKIFKTFGLKILTQDGRTWPFKIPEEVDDLLFRLRDLGWHLHSTVGLSTADHHAIYFIMWTEDDNEDAIRSCNAS